MKRTLAAGTLVAALGLAGAAVLGPAVASADPAGDGRMSAIREALQGLVSDGTLDDTQADLVAERLAEVAPPRGHGPGMRGHGPGRGGHGVGKLAAEAIAEAVGVTVEELHEARHDGQSLAEIAAAEGISRDTLIDRLVALAEERIDAAVTAERLTAEQAEERKAGLEERIGAMVDRTAGPGRPGHRPRRD
jgi:hypothetical protein